MTIVVDPIVVTYPPGKTSLAVGESATIDVPAYDTDEPPTGEGHGAGTVTNPRTGESAPFTVTIILEGVVEPLEYEMTVDVGTLDTGGPTTVGHFVYTRTA